jgi:hypothetical protein
LGDSTYGSDVFCLPGKSLAKKFTDLGGSRSSHFEIDNLEEKPEKYFKDICQLIDETISYGQIEEPINDGIDSDVEDDEEGKAYIVLILFRHYIANRSPYPPNKKT